MRAHRITLRALYVLLAGCSAETVAAPPTAPANWQSLQAHAAVDARRDVVSARERGLVEAYSSALGASKFEQLNPLLDDEVHMASPGIDDAHGRKEVVQEHETLFGAFDDRKLTPTRVWRTPDEQTVEWTMTGSQAREWMGVPATHKPVAFKGLTLLWTKDDGTVTDVHVYVDVALVKAQLGAGPKGLVAPPPPAPPAGPAQVFEQPAGGGPDDKVNVALVKSWLDFLEDNKEAPYVNAVSDDLELYTLEKPQPARGKEEAKAYYVAAHKAIGQLDTTALNAWGVGQFVIVEYTLAGEQLGPIGWVPAQRDRVIRFELVDIYEIAGGKIKRVWRYDDPAQVWSTPL